ncbi:MAG: protein kinase, partial [Chitinivibrionales bacterium]|nr:protein kinase [Chitinivibrionales bacterium]MBD3355584.1 protein kinase [Chitinivibrionales bacterium]
MDPRSTPTPEIYRRALERSTPVKLFDAEGTRRTMSLTETDPQAGENPADPRAETLGDENTGGADAADAFPHRLGKARELPAALIGNSMERERYSLIRLIGKGAAGSVYEVRDNHLGRVVAVKMLNAERRNQAGRRELFIHEAQVTAGLEHPNIMPVYDIGLTENKEIFFSMKKAAGHSLGDAVREEEMGTPPSSIATLNDKISIMLKVCDAVAYAHAQGYIHQDIKPDNIMIGEYGEVLLMDWGSALPLGAEGRLTKGLVGTPVFMSPEQARREYADKRSDVYCLGASLFYLLTLRCPTWENHPEAFWEKKRVGVVDELTDEEARHVPVTLVDIVLKALSPNPKDRYQSVTAMSEDLKRFQAGLAVSAHCDTMWERFCRWYSSNGRLFWVTATSLVLIAAVGGLLYLEKRKEAVSWRRIYTTDFEGTTTSELKNDW